MSSQQTLHKLAPRRRRFGAAKKDLYRRFKKDVKRILRFELVAGDLQEHVVLAGFGGNTILTCEQKTAPISGMMQLGQITDNWMRTLHANTSM